MGKIITAVLLIAMRYMMSQSGHVVNVYHYLDEGMGFPVNGVQPCTGNDNLVCEWHSRKDVNQLHEFFLNDTEKFWKSSDNSSLTTTATATSTATTANTNHTTVFVANIHQWVGDGHTLLNLCTFPVNLTMADTEGRQCMFDSRYLILAFALALTHVHYLTHSLTHSLPTFTLFHALKRPIESRKHRSWKEEGAMERDFDAYSTTQNTSSLQVTDEPPPLSCPVMTLPVLSYPVVVLSLPLEKTLLFSQAKPVMSYPDLQS